MEDSADAPFSIIGLDIGSEKIISALYNGEVIRNELGGVGISTIIFFSNSSRYIGESAVSFVSGNPSNCLCSVNQLVGKDYFSWCSSRDAKFRVFESEPDSKTKSPSVKFMYQDEIIKINSTALLSMILTKVLDQYKRNKNLQDDSLISVSIAYNPISTLAERRAVYDAARIAGFKNPKLFCYAACIAAVFSKKHGVALNDPAKVIIFVDMGCHQSNISVIRFLAGENYEILSSVGSSFGSQDFDYSVFEYFQSKIKARYNELVESKSKKGLRLLNACRRLRETLSTIPEAAADVDNLCQDIDVPLSLTRTELVEICRPHTDALCALFQAAVAKAGMEKDKSEVSSIELMGGGVRMHCIQEALNEYGIPFGQKMDEASLATGAAILGTAAGVEYVNEEILSAEGLQDDDILYFQKLEVNPIRNNESTNSVKYQGQRVIQTDQSV